MIQSKFKNGRVNVILISLFMLVILMVVVLYYVNEFTTLTALGILLMFSIFISWIIWGELRIKAIRVYMDGFSITARGFLGYGSSQKYLFSEFTGYKVCSISNEYEEFEYLYLMIGEKKVIRMSEFYHSNYAELKRHITSRSQSLGRERYHFFKEIKEIFS